MSILVIEDNSNDAELLLLALRRLGFAEQVSVLTRAEDAILYLQGLAPYGDRQKYPFPNLIILDLGLPGMSGADFLKWFRARPDLTTALVAVLTGSPFSEHLNEAYRLGARRFFMKPISVRQLEQLVGLVGHTLPPGPDPVTQAEALTQRVARTELRLIGPSGNRSAQCH